MRTFRRLLLMLFLLVLAIPSLAASPEHPGVYVGMMLPDGELPSAYEKFIGKKIAIHLWFNAWNQGKTDISINLIKLNKKQGRLSHVVWEPFTDLDTITNGTYDDYIRRNARALAELKFPVMLRFAHEMNGNWYPWCGVNNGGGTTNGFGDPNVPDGPERYIAAFRHIHDIFTAEGATNVLWVWTPNEGSVPAAEWNAPLRYYPGDAYVDWIGIDGYNWGSCRSYGTWRSFDQIFQSIYTELTTAIPNKPVIIAEFASTESGGDKAAWIKETYRSMRNYPRLRAAIWFNIFKETAWSIESSDASIEAYQKAVADPFFLEKFQGL